LLHGNFEYDDDPSKLFEYDDIMDLFTNTPDKSEEKYLSCDVARFGADKTVICYWEGLHCKSVQTYAKTAVDEVVELLRNIAEKKQVKMSKIIVDEDGVGGGVVDTLKGCKGFVNNSKAIQPRAATSDETRKVNYSNLKTQCYFTLASLVSVGKIGIGGIDTKEKEDLVLELEQIKQKDIDKDGKISLIGKEQIKENIGRSPDISDAIMMRMYFELVKSPILKPYFA